MPVLTVLTAAIVEWAEFVAEAGESVGAQEVPDGWEVEWVVQEDGREPRLAEIVERLPFARYEANGQRLGIATTRNVGLTRVRGDFVYALDCDDVILPGGLGVVVEAIEKFPGIHWIATQADNLLPDGTRVSFEPISSTGYIEAGASGDFIVANDRAPFLLTGIAFRTSTLRALGGWVATPNGEDFALVGAITELTPGYHTQETVWLYRQHDRQTSRQPTFTALESLSVSLVQQRIDALRAVGLHIGPA